MTTPREQLATAITAALSAVTYSARDAINHATAFEELLVKVEHNILAAGWQPPTPPLTRPSQTIPYLDN